jgi:P pilus assembly chaperone PapD
MKRFVSSLLLLLVGAGIAHAQVGISPAYYDLSAAEAQRTNSFRLFNYTTETKHVRVSLAPWDADADNVPQLLPSGPTTMDQWVVINPVEFEIKAKASQAVRFSLRPALDMAPGEHRVMLIFDEIPAPNEKAIMRARFQFRSSLYVQVGNTIRQGELGKITADAEAFHVPLKNTGNANVRLNGQFSIWHAKSFPGAQATQLLTGLNDPSPKFPEGMVFAGVIAAPPVLPGRAHTVSIAYGGTKLPPGKYVLDLNGTVGDGVLDQPTEFVVGGSP